MFDPTLGRWLLWNENHGERHQSLSPFLPEAGQLGVRCVHPSQNGQGAPRAKTRRSSTDEERQRGKRRLLKGPRELRDMANAPSPRVEIPDHTSRPARRWWVHLSLTQLSVSTNCINPRPALGVVGTRFLLESAPLRNSKNATSPASQPPWTAQRARRRSLYRPPPTARRACIAAPDAPGCG